jgi:hypothetical protein
MLILQSASRLRTRLSAASPYREAEAVFAGALAHLIVQARGRWPPARHGWRRGFFCLGLAVWLTGLNGTERPFSTKLSS